MGRSAFGIEMFEGGSEYVTRNLSVCFVFVKINGVNTEKACLLQTNKSVVMLRKTAKAGLIPREFQAL
jgi:hypothetical protein